MCYMRDYRPPGIVFTVGHEEMDDLFSLFHCTIWEIDTNELHDIYNRNFAHQTRQRVIGDML